MNSRRIIIDNIRVLPDREFSSVEEFWHYFCTFEGLYTEENLLKVLRAFLCFADEMQENDLDRPEFQEFLKKVRLTYVELYWSEQFYVALGQFLDLFCIDYPEIWVKFETSNLTD